MEKHIPVCIKRIEKIIAEINSDVFTTADVLREYSGGFFSNIGTPAACSFNALFGKLLKKNQSELQISEIKDKVSVDDDNGHKTTTSRWKRHT